MTTNWRGLFFHTNRLNYVDEFALEAGSVQGINYPFTSCASLLHTNDLEHKLVTLVGTVPKGYKVMNH